MKRLLFFSAIALLVFCLGLSVVLMHRAPQPRVSTVTTSAHAQHKEHTPIAALPALALPPGITASACPENSWEYAGEVAANFVSTSGRLSAWFQNQSWRPERRITLDASISPRVILTFSNHGWELTLMLWKINTDTTGFAYRRERAGASSTQLE